MDWTTCLSPTNVVVVYGDEDTGKTQAALRMAASVGRPIAFVDFSHTLEGRDVAFAGLTNFPHLAHYQPDSIETAFIFAKRCLESLPECILVIDPLDAARPEDYEIGGQRGLLRAQMKFLNAIQPLLLRQNGTLIVVDHSISTTRRPAATLFGTTIFCAQGCRDGIVFLAHGDRVASIAPVVV